MKAIYFLAGCIAGLAIAWYFTKQYYESRAGSGENQRTPEKNSTENPLRKLHKANEKEMQQ